MSESKGSGQQYKLFTSEGDKEDRHKDKNTKKQEVIDTGGGRGTSSSNLGSSHMETASSYLGVRKLICWADGLLQRNK